PIEVRSISSTVNGRYAFLTHRDIGTILDDFGACPNSPGPIYKVPNGHNLGYKCENYLPATQNGGGLKALVANENFIYTNAGDEIFKRSLDDGSLITTVPLPGGSSDTDIIFGDLVVHNSGMDVDSCGNVYAGSGDRVVKFDADLNILQQATVSFNVYDVSVNSNGEVLAVGAQENNEATNRNGRIQAVDMSACGQFEMVCCDVNICPVETLCDDEPAFDLPVSEPGGTFSGPGITDTNNGTFDASVAGIGTHTITYTKPCGEETIDIIVINCDVIEVCEEEPDFIASGGAGTLTWYQWETFNYSIDNEQDCIDCPVTDPVYLAGFYVGCSEDVCTGSGWSEIATGNTIATSSVTSWPIMITDGIQDTITFNNATEIPPCSPGCADPPMITLNTTSGSTCGITPVTVSSNTFGGSATEVYLGHDGSGTLDATNFTSSPF
ncbi:MAG: hypothetical protein U9Q98_10010, partial [Bacteroidota bacterium]|nr:hypothetical protein [Bacteroidota bacterium]